MKRIGLLFAICLWAVLLTGCHHEAHDDVHQLILGQEYDTGQFRVLVPEGWRAFPVTDPFAEGRPVKTDSLFLRKGGQSDWHVFEKPYLRIDYYDADKQPELSVTEDDLQKNIEELPGMELGSLSWSGYTADSYHGRACIGRFAILRAEDGQCKYQVYIWFESGGETISLEDRDLQAILASVAASGSP